MWVLLSLYDYRKTHHTRCECIEKLCMIIIDHKQSTVTLNLRSRQGRNDHRVIALNLQSYSSVL